MKMNYRLKSKKKRSILIEGVSVALLLLAVFFTPLAGLFSPPLFFAARPLLIAERHVFSYAESIAGFFSAQSVLVAENKALQAENTRLQTRLADHDFLQQEYRALVTSFGHAPENPAVVIAAVLAKPPQTSYDTLVTDAGRREGIAVGDRVRVGTLSIGDVIDVEERISKIALFSTPGRISTVTLQNGVSVSARGEGGGSFRFSLPRDVEIREGDSVFFPGTPGVYLGTVGSVEARPTEPFKIVLFEGPVTMAQLVWVEIAKTDRGGTERTN